jgi:hypothetical protein
MLLNFFIFVVIFARAIHKNSSVKTWDLRVAAKEHNAVATFTHGEPVEALLTLPGGSLLVTIVVLFQILFLNARYRSGICRRR